MTARAKAMIEADRVGVDHGAPLYAVRAARRNGNRIRQLHHHAVRTDDMEATRRFYEGVLDMPMVAALRDNIDPGTGVEMPFLHCFFEMGDGGCLAFFQFPPDALGPADKLPRDAVDHHIALSVAAFDDIVRFKAKLDALGYANCGINHGFCYSLYVRDPNDMLVELSVNAPNELELGEAAATTAHKELTEWTKKGSTNSRKRAEVIYPLPTSPREEIARVIRGAR